jgi:hypothetical protein
MTFWDLNRVMNSQNLRNFQSIEFSFNLKLWLQHQVLSRLPHSGFVTLTMKHYYHPTLRDLLPHSCIISIDRRSQAKNPNNGKAY